MALIALVPLDGTQLSESAFSLLPLVKQLGVDHIRLVGVWEGAWEEAESGRESAELGEVTEKGRAFLEAYLDQKAEAVAAQGFEVEKVVRVGRPADELLEAQEDVDLILIATHGRSGIARWWLGSVADRVIKEATAPCLVIGPNVDVDLAEYRLERIMVPLDGSTTAEEALPVAAFIADKTGAELDIVRAMSLTAVTYDPGMSMYSAELVTSMEDSVKAYLQGVSARLGDRRVQTTMLLGGPGEMLLGHLEDRPAGLVVCTTHGRRGVARAALGSTTDRLLHGSAPVLVFRPDSESQSEIIDAARNSVRL